MFSFFPGLFSKNTVQISGNLAADISLVETKSALDEMTRKLVSEFNELHKLGTTLDGDLGSNFFNLRGLRLTKLVMKVVLPR